MSTGSRRAVVLLSGGMDSAVTAAIAKSERFEVHALTLRYGQRHSVEIQAASRVANALGLASHKIVDLDLRAIGGSALTADIDVPKGPPLPATSPDGPTAPATYVPARNTILLGLALGHAETIGARDLFIGVSSVDYSGYPDCRPAFVDAFQQLAQLATRAGADEGARFTVHAPLQKLSKADTVRLAVRLGVDLGLTHTCYDPDPEGRACGECDACRLRRKGFDEAGVADPTRYAGSTTPAPTNEARSGEAQPPEAASPPNADHDATTTSKSTSVRVMETYRSIQGESTMAGTPCAIVRLAGCPLRCSWCDTDYAREAEGTKTELPTVIETVRGFGVRLVLVTGGEPLAQPGTPDLLRALADEGFDVMLETSGAFDISGVDPRVRRVVDVKCPSSGMSERNLPTNRTILRRTDELKFVIADARDYEWARDLVRSEALDSKCTVLFSPAAGRMAPADLAERILSDNLPVRLQLQLHRILWPDTDRGV